MTTYNAYATYYSFNYIDLYRINGAPGTAFVPGENYVLEMSLNEANAKGYNHRWSLGQYMGAWNASEGPNNYSGGLRGYNGMIAEVIAFNRELTADERASVVAYLKEKWENSDSTATVSFEDQNLKLELGDATLDLAGTSQRLDGIAGAGGSICNGSMVISGEIEFDVSATNPTFDFGGAAIEDGLKVTFASTPDRVRYVIARNVGSGNVATFIPPAPGWYLSLSNGELVASRGGMVIIIK